MPHIGMSKFKTALLTLGSALALSAASSACAASFEVWNGSSWVNSGSTHFTGPISISYIGMLLPCNADLGVTISAGTAAVTSWTLSGSTACAGATAHNLPWPISVTSYSGPNPPFTGAPLLAGPLYEVSLSGMRFYLPPPMNVYCPSSAGAAVLKGVIDADGKLVFKQNVGPCSIQTRATFSLQSSPKVRVVP
ncbi:hypothetical protein [Pseudomonas sp. CGJS7]|uniref:hypothetical protein n=1 Tax=Pseudomonas sp. CGJS7 TaxID=3109348 RepID=UPI00300ABD4A